MDRNLLLAFALSFAVLLMWTMVVDPPPRPDQQPGVSESEEASGSMLAPPGGEQQPAPSDPDLPRLDPLEPRAPVEVLAESRRLKLETDLYRAEIDTRGAAIVDWTLYELVVRKPRD